MRLGLVWGQKMEMEFCYWTDKMGLGQLKSIIGVASPFLVLVQKLAWIMSENVSIAYTLKMK